MEEQAKRDSAQSCATLQITIAEGKEYQNRPESIYEPRAFFFNSYRQAAHCLGEILRAGAAYQQDCRQEEKQISDEQTNQSLLGYSNNIIAFCADRGNGKTSAMVSFANALTGLCDEKNKRNWERCFPEAACAKKYQFEVIHSIDPTAMRESDSIVTVILSRIFSRFQDYWERRCSFRCVAGSDEVELTKRRVFLQRLQKCFRNMQVQVSGNSEFEDDALERIMELGDYSNMRGALYRLVCAYLDFVCSSKDSYLVLQIDDADLSLGNAYQLIDEIRRNLVMPRVVILLAANMNQLESTVEQHFIEQYQNSIRHGGMVSIELCHTTASRYMDKVIPGDRQVHLPNLSKIMAEMYNSIGISYQRPESEDSMAIGECYQEQLLRYLYERTGIILLNPENHLHNLLPGNMRELTHFLPYFRRLPRLCIGYKDLLEYAAYPEKTDYQAVKEWRSNLELLERYLVEIWAPVNLRTEGHDFLRSLQSYADGNIHRHILNFLPDYYAKERSQVGIIRGISVLGEEEYRDQFLRRCVERGLRNYPRLADGKIGECQYGTYADVCEALNILSELPGALRQYKFIYSIHLYYTIHMHQILLQNFNEGKTAGRREALLSFLGDVLWRRDEVANRPAGIHYNHYTFSAKSLAENLKQMTGVNTLSQQTETIIDRFCRKIDLQRRRCTACSANFSTFYKRYCEDNAIPDEELCFHIYYPLLQDIEVLIKTDRPEVERDALKEAKPQRNQILLSMIMLLNWDVQYLLSRSLMERTGGDDTASGLIINDIRSAYADTSIDRLLVSVHRVTGEEWNLKPLPFLDGSTDGSSGESTDEKKEFTAVVLAIQFSIPELKERAYVYFQKLMETLLALLQDLRQMNVPPEDTLAQIIDSQVTSDSKGRGTYKSDIVKHLRDVMVAFSSLEAALHVLIELTDDATKGEGGPAPWDLSLEHLQQVVMNYKDTLEKLMRQDNTSF